MTLYTAIFGGYDFIKPIVKDNPDWNYVLFTDSTEGIDKYIKLYPELRQWEIRIVPTPKDPIREARKYKILPHRFLEGDTLWIDATFIPNTQEWTVGDFVTVQHPFDNCIYSEAKNCLRMGKGEAMKIQEQVDYYKDLGILTNRGLISSGVLYRRQTEDVTLACELWWKQVEEFSTRDQIGFGIVKFINPDIRLIKWDYTQRREFIHIPHRHKEWGEFKLIDELRKELGYEKI